jgi:hypothetical protein
LSGSNCELRRHGDDRVEFSFPNRDGYVSPGRWEFDDYDDLVGYIADLLSVEIGADGLRGTIRQVGKYERRDVKGERSFTFGDPILDLITDPAGSLSVAGRAHHLAVDELGSPRHRFGGNRRIDLAGASNVLLDTHLARAAMGQGDMTIVEANDDVVAFASTNPSQRDFIRNGHQLRFKAWKKNLTFYWSMGAEIETWGHDFTTAKIESTYYADLGHGICTVVKTDSDSDKNDDYVDEYEWGVNSTQPLRVVSRCTANWDGAVFLGQVEAGPLCLSL